MKQCVRCDRQYPDSAGKFCELDGSYLISLDDFDQLPEGMCPCCTGLSPGIAMDGETIVHCPVCHDTGKATPKEAERYEEEMRKYRERTND
jgi:hypothetical protein